MLSIKGLSSRLRLKGAQVAKDLTIKHRRKMYCKYDGTWYQFSANSEVIVPYKQAKEYAISKNMILPELIDVNNLNYDHLNPKDREKIPVVVLLGHFNHGKTTLLDSLGGTSYVEEEKHSITQTIRTKLVSTSATHRITIVDTPGQEVFYRMRSYGASIADMALLLVAADDGICLQTKESLGILEQLGIPAIACINKIDLPAFKDPSRLDSLEEELKDYVGLTDAPVVRISAKDKINFPVLLEKLEAIAQTALANKQSENQKASVNDKEDSDALNIVSSGTILNIFKNRQQGTALHVIVRSGELKVGDSFSAGGWCGTVRTLHHTNNNDRSTVTSTNTATATATATATKKNKSNHRAASAEAKEAPTPAVPQVPLADPSVASAGMAVTVMVTLHPDVTNPRPVGDTIRFHRDAATIRRDHKKKLVMAGISSVPSVPTTSTALRQASSQQKTITHTKMKTLSRESFELGREAAEYCMERNQLEMRLASFAVTPADAIRFRLERLLALFQRQKPGFRGEECTVQRVINAAEREEGDTDTEEISSTGDGSVEDGGEEEEVLPHEDDGDDGPTIRTVIVKTDSDITLGTLFDKYGDEEEAHAAAVADAVSRDASPPPPMTHVLSWGLGEVGLNDVNLASAGDAVIVAYNVGVDRSAARQALNLNVKIIKFDLLEDAARAVLGSGAHDSDPSK